ncbi:MAG: cystathionine gamma-synthase family protein [Deltaproteobacteria bacterium]|nr:cystathionine gamma-synthase family protein [Deltaproteobacteria bacterium]
MRRRRKREVETARRVLHPESRMMSYGYRPEWSEGALKCPVFQTSTFVFQSAEEGKAFFEVAYGLRTQGPSEVLGLIYSRLNNPDLEILEDRLTVWDDAEACAVFDSGMAAISTVLLQFLGPGDVVLHSEPLYGGTDYLLHHVLPRFGVRPVGFPAASSREEIDAILGTGAADGRLALIYAETPANPTNALVDLSVCAELARAHSSADRRVLLVVDNTFLGPLWQHPLKHGADLVVYSATKYIGGHSDLIAGACVGPADLVRSVRTLRTFLGNMADPWTGWLLLRSLETLKLRMTCQKKNAARVGEFLQDHPKVARTYYLGHLGPDDAQFAVYRRQCLGAGAMISFDLAGGQEQAYRFLNALKLVKLAVSLGGTESLAEHPSTMTHADVAQEEQRRMGISPSMVRLSVGVEHPDDIVADLEQALASA